MRFGVPVCRCWLAHRPKHMASKHLSPKLLTAMHSASGPPTRRSCCRRGAPHVVRSLSRVTRKRSASAQPPALAVSPEASSRLSSSCGWVGLLATSRPGGAMPAGSQGGRGRVGSVGGSMHGLPKYRAGQQAAPVPALRVQAPQARKPSCSFHMAGTGGRLTCCAQQRGRPAAAQHLASREPRVVGTRQAHHGQQQVVVRPKLGPALQGKMQTWRSWFLLGSVDLNSAADQQHADNFS